MSVPAKPKKKRHRNVIDMEEKMLIIKLHEEGKRFTEIAKQRNLSASTISTIIKDKARIQEIVAKSPSIKFTIISKARSGTICEMEKELTSWMQEQIRNRCPLSFNIVKGKAKEFFESIKTKNNDTTSTFAASNGWFSRFKKRSGFHNVRITGDKAVADTEAANEFTETLARIIDGNYLPEQIFNAGETTLFWKRTPDRNINPISKTIPGFSVAKDRLTLLLGGNLAGYKLKPLMIYHSENPNALKGINKESLPVHFRSHPKVWATAPVFENWFVECFVPEVMYYCSQNQIPFKILLVMSTAPGHTPLLDTINDNVSVVFMPPNTTSVIQPIDQGIVRTFKAYYLRNILNEAIGDFAGRQINLSDFWKAFDILKGINQISKSWFEVQQPCMIGAWKTILSNSEFAMDYSGIPMILRELNKEILTLAKALNLEIGEENIEHWLDAVEEELSADDLTEMNTVNTVKREVRRVSKKEPESDKDDMDMDTDMYHGFESVLLKDGDNSDESDNGDEPVHTEFHLEKMSLAFKKIQEAMTLLEKMDPNRARFSRINWEIQQSIAPYKEIYEKKKKLLV